MSWDFEDMRAIVKVVEAAWEHKAIMWTTDDGERHGKLAEVRFQSETERTARGKILPPQVWYRDAGPNDDLEGDPEEMVIKVEWDDGSTEIVDVDAASSAWLQSKLNILDG